MILLLPPSEGKTAPSRGKSIELEQITLPQLEDPRVKVLSALAELAVKDTAEAAERIGLGVSQRDELAPQALLQQAPTAAAWKVYTGVLYERLDFASLPAGAKRKAASRLLIFSGLWGVVGINDRIPTYRCSVGSDLPGLPGLASFWKPYLSEALSEPKLAVDLRSGPYRAMWKPEGKTHVQVDVVREANGKRSVVSHMAKATRGDIARELLVGEGPDPKTPKRLAERLRTRGWEVELSASGSGHTLTVVERG